MRRAKVEAMGFIVIILLLSSATAAGFGYVEERTMKQALPGDDVSFSLYVSGTNESVKVTRIDHPDNWRVKVDPDRVNFPVNENYRYIETRHGYQKIAPMRVAVETPLDARSGTHRITVFLATGANTAQVNTSGVAVRQIQSIDFTVDIVGGTARISGKDQDEGTQPQTEEQSRSADGGLTITGSDTETATTQGEATRDWAEDPVVLLLLFEIMWGIGIIYVLKRRNYL